MNKAFIDRERVFKILNKHIKKYPHNITRIEKLHKTWKLLVHFTEDFKNKSKQNEEIDNILKIDNEKIDNKKILEIINVLNRVSFLLETKKKNLEYVINKSNFYKLIIFNLGEIIEDNRELLSSRERIDTYSYLLRGYNIISNNKNEEEVELMKYLNKILLILVGLL